MCVSARSACASAKSAVPPGSRVDAANMLRQTRCLCPLNLRHLQAFLRTRRIQIDVCFEAGAEEPECSSRARRKISIQAASIDQWGRGGLLPGATDIPLGERRQAAPALGPYARYTARFLLPSSSLSTRRCRSVSVDYWTTKLLWPISCPYRALARRPKPGQTYQR
jgi:hypothetical protein